MTENMYPFPKVTDLPLRERPSNRLHHAGPKALSDAELIACVLSTPQALAQARALLVRFRGLAGLKHAGGPEVQELPGLGPVAYTRLKAALELAGRIQRPLDRVSIRAPAHAANYLLPHLAGQEHEMFYVLLLDTRNRLIACVHIYTGTISSQHVRAAEVLREAVRQNAPAMIIAHNHPSGDPTPSPEDVALTRNMVNAGELLDIEVIDHLIIGSDRWISLKERGLGFR